MTITTIYKQPGEVKTYNMDFSRALKTGETISSVTSVTPTKEYNIPGSSNISISNISNNTDNVQFKVSGGTDAEKYKITVLIQTSLGDTLEGEGFLIVNEI